MTHTLAVERLGLECDTLRADSPRLIDLLHKLIAYFRGVPSETARFTKDAEFLRQVAQQSTEREVLIQTISAALTNFS